MRFVYYNPLVTAKKNSTRVMNKKPVDKVYEVLKIIQILKKEKGEQRSKKTEETNRILRKRCS